MNLVGPSSNLLRSPSAFTEFDHMTNQVYILVKILNCCLFLKKNISYFEGLWWQLEPNDLSLFHAPPLLVKVIMEVIGQVITLLVMRIWLYLYQVRFSVIYWLKQGLSWTKNLESHDNTALIINVFVCLICFCRGEAAWPKNISMFNLIVTFCFIFFKKCWIWTCLEYLWLVLTFVVSMTTLQNSFVKDGSSLGLFTLSPETTMTWERR